jgi:hypothetical protein
MIKPETERFKDYMAKQEIIFPYTLVAFMNEEIRKIGITVPVKGIVNEVYTPWLI